MSSRCNPSYSKSISEMVMPLASNPKMKDTLNRVPWMMGFPTRISGFNSIRLIKFGCIFLFFTKITKKPYSAINAGFIPIVEKPPS